MTEIKAIKIPCYPCDKEVFPGNQYAANSERESTTFFNDFKIAEEFGIEAVKDTFNRAFDSWKDNIKYLCELALVTNNLGWYHYNHNGDLSAFYFDAFNKCCDYVYQEDADGNRISPFSKEEVVFFHTILD